MYSSLKVSGSNITLMFSGLPRALCPDMVRAFWTTPGLKSSISMLLILLFINNIHYLILLCLCIHIEYKKK